MSLIGATRFAEERCAENGVRVEQDVSVSELSVSVPRSERAKEFSRNCVYREKTASETAFSFLVSTSNLRIESRVFRGVGFVAKPAGALSGADEFVDWIE